MNTLFADLYSPSLELILLAVAIVGSVVLASAVYRSDPKGVTNLLYLFLSAFTVLWLVNNYLTGHLLQYPQYADLSLVVSRFGILWAAPMSALFLLFAHTVPSRSLRMSRNWYYAILGVTFVMMLLNVSPYAFTGVHFDGSSLSPEAGLGLAPFSVFSTLFSIFAVYFLVQRTRKASGEEREQLRLVLSGILIMLGFIIATVLVPILAFNSLAFLPFTPIYVLVFLGMTAYAITTYHLFSIKVLVTQAVTATMILVLFAKLFGETTTSARVVDALVLLSMIVFGYFLVRSVKKEVEQRMLIEKQEKELEIANRQQESLLHFISHEVKGYLTKNQAAFAAISGGDFGAVNDSLRHMSEAALLDTRKGVDTVMDILDASNLKKGTVSFSKRTFDLCKATSEMVAETKRTIQTKGLTLSCVCSHEPLTIMGDEDKVRRHVIRNLIDNAVRYTPSGSIRLTLTKEDGVVRLITEDTGVGITPEDMERLFTEGGHGAESIKVNVDSTGYGLFIAKQIVEAHGGKIWAESEGRGRGSRFIVELPAA